MFRNKKERIQKFGGLVEANDPTDDSEQGTQTGAGSHI